MSNKTDATPRSPASAGSACAHREQPAMGYLQWHEDADQRLAAGEQQHRCHVCGLYIWSEFWKSPNAPHERPPTKTL